MEWEGITAQVVLALSHLLLTAWEVLIIQEQTATATATADLAPQMEWVVFIAAIDGIVAG